MRAVFEKQFKIGSVTVDRFASEKSLGSIQRSAEALGRMLEYFRKAFGPSAAGDAYRLVEVDDRLSVHPAPWGPSSSPAASWPWNARLSGSSRGGLRTSGGAIGRRAERRGPVAGRRAGLLLRCTIRGESRGAEGFRNEMEELAVLALRFESRARFVAGSTLGYQTEPYESVVCWKGRVGAQHAAQHAG